MKKILSLLLVFALLLGMVPAVFAAGVPTVTVTADKTTVKAGESVTLTLSIDQDVKNLMNFEFAIYFDAAAYTKTGFTIGDAYKNQPGGSTVVGDKVNIGGKNALRVSGLSTLGDPLTLRAGMIATVTFTATENINAENAGFKITTEAMNDYDTIDMIEGGVKLEGSEIPMTIAAEEPNYTVTMGADQTVTAGEAVSIPVTVGNSGDVATYNAFDLSFTYDASILELTSTELEGMTVTAGNGTLRVQGYGTDRAVDTAPFALGFRAKTAGNANVTLTSAKVDRSANAITLDAPEAVILDGTTVVTVSGYSVTLPEDFTGESVAMPGEDYTFTAKDQNYDYEVIATVGGKNADVIDNGDGSFTIKNVDGNIIVTATKTAKQFKVTVNGTGADDAKYADTAKYGEDYVLQLTEKAGYDYTVEASVGGKSYTPTRLTTDGSETVSYTIAGADITGDIVFTITKTAQAPITTSITFTGSGSGDVVGGTTQTAPNGTDFTFELNKDAGFDYTVKLGAEELLPGVDGKYTIPGAKLTGEALTVTVEKTAKQTITVDAAAYIQLDGKTMWLVTAAGTVSEGKVLAYDGTPMFWSGKYNAYCYLVVSVKGAEEVKTEASEKIAEADAKAATIAYSADVNGTGLVDINDAQLVWDMYNAKYDAFDAVSMRKFLEADVNGDLTVNVSDATAVVAATR